MGPEVPKSPIWLSWARIIRRSYFSAFPPGGTMVEKIHLEDFIWDQKYLNRQIDHPDPKLFYFSTFLLFLNGIKGSSGGLQMGPEVPNRQFSHPQPEFFYFSIGCKMEENVIWRPSNWTTRAKIANFIILSQNYSPFVLFYFSTWCKIVENGHLKAFRCD